MTKLFTDEMIETTTLGSSDRTYISLHASTASDGGTWLGTDPKWEPDMSDWTSEDIIDHYAQQLADKHKARELKTGDFRITWGPDGIFKTT